MPRASSDAEVHRHPRPMPTLPSAVLLRCTAHLPTCPPAQIGRHLRRHSPPLSLLSSDVNADVTLPRFPLAIPLLPRIPLPHPIRAAAFGYGTGAAAEVPGAGASAAGRGGIRAAASGGRRSGQAGVGVLRAASVRRREASRPAARRVPVHEGAASRGGMRGPRGGRRSGGRGGRGKQGGRGGRGKRGKRGGRRGRGGGSWNLAVSNKDGAMEGISAVGPFACSGNEGGMEFSSDQSNSHGRSRLRVNAEGHLIVLDSEDEGGDEEELQAGVFMEMPPAFFPGLADSANASKSEGEDVKAAAAEAEGEDVKATKAEGEDVKAAKVEGEEVKAAKAEGDDVNEAIADGDDVHHGLIQDSYSAPAV